MTRATHYRPGQSGYSNYGCRCGACCAAHESWLDQNRERINAQGRRYYAANRERVKASNKAYAERNREAVAMRAREYRERHKERLQRSQRRNYRANRDAAIARATRWNRENPERRREIVQSSYARKAGENQAADRERVRAYAKTAAGRAVAARCKAKNSLIPSPRAYRDWTPGEDSLVMRDDLNLREIACQLGRSVKAVNVRRARLRSGWSRSAPYPRIPWTPGEDVTVMRTDITTQQIADILGRSYHSVNMRRHQLRKRSSA